MRFKILLTFLFIGICFLSFAQTVAVGQVVDAENGKPLENVSVYLDKTQIGIKTNAAGSFKLTIADDAKLVVSYMGYEKVIITEFAKQKILIVKLNPKKNNLNEVIVKQEWEKWGILFTQLLMGDDIHSYYSRYFGSAVVLNKYDVHFSYAEDEEKLTASSTAPLFIYNAQTGYLVKLQLEEFIYLFREDWLKMKASISLEETLTSQTLSQLQIATNNAYYGSMLHFCTALAKGRLKEEGFTVRKFIGIKNLEKKRVLDILCNINNIKYAINKNYLNYHIDEFTSNIDTARYFKKVLRRDDFVSYRVENFDISQYLKFDSLKKIYTLKIKDTLQITYLKNRRNELVTNLSKDFINQSKINKYESLICFPDNGSLEFSSGGKVKLNGVIVRGYMNLNRLAHVLPDDFDPNLPRVKVNNDALKNHAIFRDERP